MRLLCAQAFLILTATTAWNVDGHTNDAEEHARSERMVHGHKTSLLSSSNIRRRRETQVTILNDEEREIRAIVDYTDEEGKQLVLSNAKELFKDFDKDNFLVVTLNKTAIDTLEKSQGIKSVELDYPMEGFSVDSSAFDVGAQFDEHDRALLEDTPYGIRMVEADQLDVGPDFVPTVCIVDTGYAIDHPDLPSDRKIVGGTSRPKAYGNTQQWDWDQDQHGHGSHVAGVIAAISGNNKGVVGAGNIKLHIARGLSDTSSAYESDILEATQDCIDAGANIINLSLGGDGMSRKGQEMYRKAVEDHGMLVVAASGNHGELRHQYPASHPSVISVSAVYEWEKYWDGSNFSNQIELAAPGHRVLSTSLSNDAVHTSDFSFPANRLQSSLIKEVSGDLIYCGMGNNGCPGAKRNICLMVRSSSTPVFDLVETCELAGGVGAIVFSDGSVGGEWSTETSIPAVRVSTEQGERLVEQYENTRVSIGYKKNKKEKKEYTYNYFTGTSMATPHVSAVAALVWSHFPECTNHQIRYALAKTAHDKGLAGCDWDYGHGIVKAKAAYDFLKLHGCSTFDQPPSNGGCTTV